MWMWWRRHREKGEMSKIRSGLKGSTFTFFVLNQISAHILYLFSVLRANVLI